MPMLKKEQLDNLIKIYNQKIGKEEKVSDDALNQEEKAINALLSTATQNNSKATGGVGVLQVCQCLLGNTPGILEYEEKKERYIDLSEDYSDAYYSFLKNILKEIFNLTNSGPSTPLIEVLILLNSANLINEENFNVFSQCKYFPTIKIALDELHKAGLLNQESFNFITQYKENFRRLTHILYIINKLIERSLFSQDTYERLSGANGLNLCTVVESLCCSNSIPWSLVTIEDLDELIAVAQETNGDRDRILGRANEIFDIPDPIHVRGNDINDAQSTHVNSVHKSVSLSAQKLLKRYGEGLSDQENILAQIENYLDRSLQLIESKKDEIEAAIRCFRRLTEKNYADEYYTDEKSGVSVRQLLVLSYLAITDDNLHTGNLDDVKERFFIDGLYEIQRGYNLSEIGIDNKEKKDKFICVAGTFNKLIEKLSGGVHPDVEIIFVTSQTASAKLPIIVREEVRAYLVSLLPNFKAINELVDKLNNEGIEEIWDKIKPQIEQRLFNEFSSLYRTEGRKNPAFVELIKSGIYADLGDLSHYPQQMADQKEEDRESSQRISVLTDDGVAGNIVEGYINSARNRKDADVPSLIAQRSLFIQLKTLAEKETQLRNKGHKTAADSLKKLYETVSSSADKFYKAEIDSRTFEKNSFEAILKARPELEKHRGYKEILSNLAIAVVSCILPYFIIGLINQRLRGRFLFFKAQTDSANKINCLEQAVKSVANCNISMIE